MDAHELESRLSAITTRWSVLQRAHADPDSGTPAEFRDLVGKYLGASYRYLLAAVQNPETAEELTQEFAVRFLSGRFKSATPAKGRFRDYLKTCLFHLVDDHFRARRRGPAAVALSHDMEIADPRSAGVTQDAIFLESWRSEILARTWSALQEFEQQTGQLYYTVLRLRAEFPDLASADLAEKLSTALDRPMTASNARQLLRRSRERFGELLFQEAAASIGTDADDRVREELTDLGLSKYLE